MLRELRSLPHLRGLALLAGLLCLAAVGCARRSDEERLRDAIDPLPVHLYAALKVAVLEPGRDADVKAARTLLDEGTESMAARAPGALPQVGVADALALGRALWALRGIGQQEVAAGRESTLPPLLA